MKNMEDYVTAKSASSAVSKLLNDLGINSDAQENHIHSDVRVLLIICMRQQEEINKLIKKVDEL